MPITHLRNELIRKMRLPVEMRISMAGGIRTVWFEAGHGDPVVLLHGAGGGGLLWGPLIERLSHVCRVIVPDIPGYGESEKPAAAYDRPFFVSWLNAFFDVLDLSAAYIIANSQGGAIAMGFAVEKPERAIKLILACPAGFSLRMKVTTLSWIFRAGLFPTRTNIQKMAGYLMHQPRNFPVREALAYLEAVSHGPGGGNAFRMSRGRSVFPFSRETLSSLNQPVLLVWGDRDRLLPPIHAQKGLRYIPDVRLELMADAGHTPFLDHPELFFEISRDFLFG